ncbi:hypothetical protein AgCh_012684 [Apium graveolens]
MDCHTVPPAKIIFLSSHCSKKRVPWILWPLRKLDHGYIDRLKYMCYKYQYSKGRQSIHHISWQTCCTQSIPEEEYSSPQAANSSNPMHVDEFDMEEVLSQPLRRAETVDHWRLEGRWETLLAVAGAAGFRRCCRLADRCMSTVVAELASHHVPNETVRAGSMRAGGLASWRARSGSKNENS